MTYKIFLHGVPNSPAIWSPVLNELELNSNLVATPILPGFQSNYPKDFDGTKDAYAKWAVGLVREAFSNHGPIDLIGHDWGALLVHRASMLVPKMVRSWALSGAAISPHYFGHNIAKVWNTPFAGELFMRVTTARILEFSLINDGVPKEIARTEASHWKNRHMRASILALYRSANGLKFQQDWCRDLNLSPKTGLLIWGARDRYVPKSIAEKLAKEHTLSLKLIQGAGHFALTENPHEFASALDLFWRGLD